MRACDDEVCTLELAAPLSPLLVILLKNKVEADVSRSRRDRGFYF